MLDQTSDVSENFYFFRCLLEVLGKIHWGCFDLCCWVKTARDSNLEAFHKVLQLGCLGFCVCDLLFQEFEVPYFSINVSFRSVFDSVSMVPLSEAPDHNSLCLCHHLQRNLLQKRARRLLNLGIVLASFQTKLVGEIDNCLYKKVEVCLDHTFLILTVVISIDCTLLFVICCCACFEGQTAILQDREDVCILSHQLSHNFFAHAKSCALPRLCRVLNRMRLLLLNFIRQLIC